MNQIHSMLQNILIFNKQLKCVKIKKCYENVYIDFFFYYFLKILLRFLKKNKKNNN